jgi:hypothetical protein
MKLNFVHLCDYAFLGDNGKINLIGIFESFYPKSVPFSHSQFFIVTNATVNKSGTVKQLIKIVRNRDNTDIVAPLEFELTAGSVSESGETKVGVLGRLDGVTFEEEGNYTIQVFIDGEKIGGSPLSVVKVK